MLASLIVLIILFSPPILYVIWNNHVHSQFLCTNLEMMTVLSSPLTKNSDETMKYITDKCFKISLFTPDFMNRIEHFYYRFMQNLNP